MRKFQARQGDVFIQMVEAIPTNVKLVEPDQGRTILAYGEVTGHAHALPSRAKLFREMDQGSGGGFVSYLEIKGLPVMLQHEEHAPIELLQGKYRVTIQREYSPQEIRAVAD